MYTDLTMSVGYSMIVSAMGFSIVFLVLAFLAVVILGFAKVFSAKKAAPAAAAPAPAPVVEDKSETVAIITSVICEELSASPEELNITSIREL